MATLTYRGDTFTVDHAVQGSNYIHGYDASGIEICSFDEVSSFDDFTYTGTYMAPTACAQERCNDVKLVSNALKTTDGTIVTGGNVSYSGATSGLAATHISGAIDEVYMNYKLERKHAIAIPFFSSCTWTAPSNIVGNKVRVICVGGGGGTKGGSGYAFGGAGSGYVQWADVTVSPGTSYPVVIGSGSDGTGAGGTTSFGSFLYATGGESSGVKLPGGNGCAGGGGAARRYNATVVLAGGTGYQAGGGGGATWSQAGTITNKAGGNGYIGGGGGVPAGAGTIGGNGGTQSTPGGQITTAYLPIDVFYPYLFDTSSSNISNGNGNGSGGGGVLMPGGAMARSTDTGSTYAITYGGGGGWYAKGGDAKCPSNYTAAGTYQGIGAGGGGGYGGAGGDGGPSTSTGSNVYYSYGGGAGGFMLNGLPPISAGGDTGTGEGSCGGVGYGAGAGTNSANRTTFTSGAQGICILLYSETE